MENFNFVEYFIAQGPWAVLFVWLFYSVRKESREREREITEESRKRESKLYGIIDKMSEKYDLVIVELRDIKDRISK